MPLRSTGRACDKRRAKAHAGTYAAQLSCLCRRTHLPCRDPERSGSRRRCWLAGARRIITHAVIGTNRRRRDGDRVARHDSNRVITVVRPVARERIGRVAPERGRREGRVNRVVLLTDGLANVGITAPEQLLGLCARLATRCDVDGGHVTCSCPGFEYRGAW